MDDQNQKIQEIQMLEQNIQNLFLQKQAFQMELSETQSSLKELQNSGDEVFKIIGQLMIKTEKPKMKEDILNKEKLLNVRMKTIEKQESSLTDQLGKLREEVMKSIKK